MTLVSKTSSLFLTLYHYLAFIIRLFFLILLSPLFLLYVWLKVIRHKLIFKKELRKCGIGRSHAKALARSTPKLSELLKTISKEEAE